MTGPRSTLRGEFLVLLSIAIAAMVFAQEAAGQNLFRGTTECLRCHDKPTKNDTAQGVLSRVRLIEAVIWEDKDKHSNSYRNLSSSLGQQIGKLLKADVLNAATGCIQCHTPAIDAAKWENGVVQASEGVGCEACHGPSSNWAEDHDDFELWSRVSPASKKDRGWIDVRSAVARAENCVSCHVGSAADGRVITHAMYAAGHPTLSGFEIESFASKMPRHWHYPYEKPGGASPSFDRTQNLLTASVVAVRMSVELSMADATAPREEDRWPELARFDCFACHHDLDGDDESGQSQFRTAGGVPGRPQLTVGCMPLVAVAAHVAKGGTADKDLAELAKQLQAPFQSSAFGDSADLAERGPSIVGWCRSVEQGLAARPLTPAQATAVLHEIANQAASEDRDFDTARQLFGAWKIVYEELVTNNALPLSPQSQQQVDARLARIEARDPFVLERRPPRQPGAGDPEDQSVEARLPELFGNRAKYAPAEFAKFMRALDDLTRQ